jgi:hypothetical protein
MVPRAPTRQDIIDYLGRAAEEAQHAEAYHANAANPRALQGRAAHQAARDAAAMQLIELAGCAENFTRGRGDPGTTLARFDDALKPVFDLRTAHTHPENSATPPPLTPKRLHELIEHLRTAIGNLDAQTLRVEPPAEIQALNRTMVGLSRIEKDGVPDAGALRARDLHYAGYYHEIRFGRLAKASGLYDNWGKSIDPRHLDVNSSIFDADNLAHKFHAMRSGTDKEVLPVSIVAPEHRNRVPDRLLSDVMRELRYDYQTPLERLVEVQLAENARKREQFRDAIQGLAETYAEITGDAKAAALIRDYVQRKEPRLDRDAIEEMSAALRTAAAPDGDYLELPEAVRTDCLELCLALDEQGDGRLVAILDAAEERSAELERNSRGRGR